MAIDDFDGKYRFLSNFYFPSPVTDEFGLVYSSVEAAYQASKALDRELRIPFTYMSPGPAKKAGRPPNLVIRPDWEQVKYEVMRGFLEQKFSNPQLRQMLVDTGDEELIEGNTWGDVIWGVYKGVGTNWLGKILMEIREKAKNEKS